MKKTFCEECGENVDFMGDIGARFKAVASELYSIVCYGDFIFKQAFPQTATGAYLNFHGYVRDMRRKAASKAATTLRFSISEAADGDILIPKNTICASAERPYIQFQTDENSYIPQGELYTDVQSTALESSEQYNVAVGEISVMVNPPSGVTAVTNITEGVGGCSDESDEKFRNRVVNSFRVPPLGVTTASMAEVVERIDEVLECQIYKNGSTLDVYVRTPDNAVSQELSDKIMNALSIVQLMDMNIAIRPAQPVEISITAICRFEPYTDETAVKTELEEIIRTNIDKIRIGENYDLTSLVCVCAKVSGVKDIYFEVLNAPESMICLNNDEYAMIQDVEVVKYE